MKISIIQSAPGTAYAAAELERFLKEYTTAEIVFGSEAAEKSVILEIDSRMPAHHYAVHGDGTALMIRGGSASSVLCGVCDALSEAGILFEASCYSAPRGFDTDTFFRVSKDVRPRFRLRGIRQHINFPMDISSYTLKDAKEYIRSLARMRFNAITFHSYPGQWHAARPDDHAGHFFYGQVHPVPEGDPQIASLIGNQKTFCIPEAEAIFEDKAKRAEYAVYWLNELMKTAKEAGMTVTLSVEIRSDDEAAESRMLRVLLENYPLIDTLEIITEENGADRDLEGITRENATEFFVDLFGESILDEDGSVPGLAECYPARCAANAVCLKRTLRALETREKWLRGLDRRPAIRAGIYCTDRNVLRVLRPILRRFLPEGVTMSLLPAHGALAAADNIAETGTAPEDWQNTMFYSWAEFDGNMYLQQMSTDGIEKLSALPPTDSSFGVCINHWRTAENRLTITYASEALISAMSAETFYRRYAEKLGVSDAEAFAAFCRDLAELDTWNRDHLFNIGFCAVGCWLSWHRNGEYMTPRGYEEADYRHAVEKYTELVRQADALLPSAETKEALAFLRLLANRCETSALHVRSMQTLEELNGIFDFDRPAPLSEEQAEKINAVLKRSRDDAVAYLHLYGEILPDRGGEGQLVSYYETTLVYIDAIIASFAGSGCDVQTEHYDDPPMPDAEAK